MLAELYQITGIASNICIIIIAVWLIKNYIQVKKYYNIYMDIDNLLNQTEEMSLGQPQGNKMKERLIQVVASGKSKQYFGRLYSTDDIDKLDDKDITKLYARYEAVLGGLITAQLKQHIIYAYARAVEVLCPTLSQGRFAVVSASEMSQSLDNAPFIDLALTSITCKLYHDYGHFLAPLEAALLTSNYIQPANQILQQQVIQQQQQNSANYQQSMKQSYEQISATSTAKSMHVPERKT